MLLQLETALEHLSSDNATVEGVLIGVVIALIFFIAYLLKRLDKKEEYIREQDKQNIEMFNTLATKIASSQVGVEDVKIELTKVGEDVVSCRGLLTTVLTTIQERLRGGQ